MEKFQSVRAVACIVFGAIGTAISHFIGGWNDALTTLIVFMALDFITGILTAAFFKKSTKTASGALSSKVGFEGVCKKVLEFILVVAAHRMDLLLGVNYIQTAAVIAFCANELISIVENAGLMGIKIPKVITNAIDILNGKDVRSINGKDNISPETSGANDNDSDRKEVDSGGGN